MARETYPIMTVDGIKQRKCLECKQTKTLDNFIPKGNRFFARCKPCHYAKMKQSDDVRFSLFKSQAKTVRSIEFQLTREDWNLLRQTKNCKCCGVEMSIKNEDRNNPKALCIDRVDNSRTILYCQL